MNWPSMNDPERVVERVILTMIVVAVCFLVFACENVFAAEPIEAHLGNGPILTSETVPVIYQLPAGVRWEPSTAKPMDDLRWVGAMFFVASYAAALITDFDEPGVFVPMGTGLAMIAISAPLANYRIEQEREAHERESKGEATRARGGRDD